jgi:predicted nucleic acid-binding protein
VSFLLDTCVLSEASKPYGDSKVLEWLAKLPDDAKFVSVISLSEICYGILVAPAGAKREALKTWYDAVLRPSLTDRVLVYDEAAALRWSELRAARKDAAVLDCQIAATAMAHGLTLATRNVKDFAFSGLAVYNPWQI